jgi:ABC-type multidrug transport system fused ATPase/permease subunit
LNRILRQAIGILSLRERSRLLRLTLLQGLVSIADIGSIAILLALIQSYAATGSPGIIGRAVQRLSDLHALLAPILVLLLFLGKNSLAYSSIKAQFEFIYSVATRLSADRLDEYFRSDFGSFTDTNSAVHTARISYQPMEYASFILGGMQQLFSELVLIILAVALMLIFKAKLFFILLLMLTPPLLLAVRFSKRRLGAARNNVKQHAERSTQDLQEALSAYVESNLYQRNAFFSGRYRDSHARLSGTLARLQIGQALPSRLMELFAVAGLLLLIVLSNAQSGLQIDPVTIGAFIAAAYKIIPGVTRMTNTLAQMRMYAYTLDASQNATGGKRPTATSPIRSICFEDIIFGFDDSAVINELSIDLKSGDLAGLSAASSRGKTTILNLILGFLQPQAGRITINDLDADQALRRDHWPQIAYVRQQAFFIHDTLLRNIILNNEEPQPERLSMALRLSGLEHVLDDRPDGLQRVVTDNGRNLSGGQRQRLAFARALYKDAPVMLLDEPFSELDAAAEQELLTALQHLAAEGRIIVLITHNESGLRACNKIIRLDA